MQPSRGRWSFTTLCNEPYPDLTGSFPLHGATSTMQSVLGLGLLGGMEKQGSSPFLKKRTKKLLLLVGVQRGVTSSSGSTARSKSFLVLFFKKEHFLLPFFLLTSTTARAQSIDTYLPAFVVGQDQALGVTVLSRQRPGYDPAGTVVGGGQLNASLAESIGENTDITGYASGSGSPYVQTHALADYAFGGALDRIIADAGVDSVAYIDQPAQSFTNWTATLGGVHALGEGTATLAYSHLQLHQIASDFGALQADAPVAYQVEDLRAAYTINLGRMTLDPQIDGQHYSYGSATLLGVPVSLTDQTRDVITAGALLRYPLSETSALVSVAEFIDNSYDHHPLDQPSETSLSGRVLAGLDTTRRGTLRVRLLLGVEVRGFEATVYATRVEPIAEGSVIWTPNGQTTATLAILRTIDDPADNGVQGYTITKGSLIVDREMRRNLLAQASLGYQVADPLQAGRRQTNLLFGASLTRLLNRHLRLVLSDSFNVQRGSDVTLSAGPGFPQTTRGGNFDRDIVSLTLKVAL